MGTARVKEAKTVKAASDKRVKVVKNLKELLSGNSVSQDVLVVGNATENGEVQEFLGILSSNQSQGTKSVSYLVHGIPGGTDYAFFDLNNLPDDYSAELTFTDGQGQVQSRSIFAGKNGNSAQPTN